MSRNLKVLLGVLLAALGLTALVPAAQADPDYRAVQLRWSNTVPTDPIITDRKVHSVDMLDELTDGGGDFQFVHECDEELYLSCDTYDSAAPIVAASPGGSYPLGSISMYIVDLPPVPPHQKPVGVIVEGTAVSGESEETDGPVAFVAAISDSGVIRMDTTDGTDPLRTSALHTENPTRIAVGMYAQDPQTLTEDHWVGLDSIILVYENTTPTGTIHMPTEWIDENYEGIPIEAEDDGYGLTRALLIGTKRNPTSSFDWYVKDVNLCPDLLIMNCPTELDPGFRLEIDPLAMKEGYSTPGVGILNGFDEGFAETSSVLKIDTKKPTVTLGGTFMSAPGMVLDGAVYQLIVEAEDGNEIVHNSGVQSIQILIDDDEIYFADQGCSEDDCEMEAYQDIYSDNYTNGEHELTVNVTDQVGHVKTDKVEFEVDR